jgi:hypothetical protein
MRVADSDGSELGDGKRCDDGVWTLTPLKPTVERPRKDMVVPETAE